MAKENLDDLVDEALKNIRDDRSMTSTLLVDLVQVLKLTLASINIKVRSQLNIWKRCSAQMNNW